MYSEKFHKKDSMTLGEVAFTRVCVCVYVRVYCVYVLMYGCAFDFLSPSPQMPPSPANTLDPSRSSRHHSSQQLPAPELYAPFSPTSMPSGTPQAALPLLTV